MSSFFRKLNVITPHSDGSDVFISILKHTHVLGFVRLIAPAYCNHVISHMTFQNNSVLLPPVFIVENTVGEL